MEVKRSSMYCVATIRKKNSLNCGVTINHICTRYGSVKAMPYDWQILLELPGTAEAVYDLEVQFKTEMDQYHYEPKIKFNGSKTECYTELSEALQQIIQ